MSKRKTQQANDNLARQQANGTHKPASQCSCGTWRTPGQTHTKGDVGPDSKGIAPQCSQ
jgi:hypothetical protein